MESVEELQAMRESLEKLSRIDWESIRVEYGNSIISTILWHRLIIRISMTIYANNW